ncbi:hypothetical protein [Micromonospora sp. HNM0581]|uniref:hypothetical protein n=1 Tax=Micromonospora sp. HNM0581 TaxID=2716341 RepID=UPI0032172496
MLLDPLRIPEDSWSHGEVLTALAARDIGGLLRWITRLTGASQSRIGAPAVRHFTGRIDATLGPRR